MPSCPNYTALCVDYMYVPILLQPPPLSVYGKNDEYNTLLKKNCSVPAQNKRTGIVIFFNQLFYEIVLGS